MSVSIWWSKQEGVWGWQGLFSLFSLTHWLMFWCLWHRRTGRCSVDRHGGKLAPSPWSMAYSPSWLPLARSFQVSCRDPVLFSRALPPTVSWRRAAASLSHLVAYSFHSSLACGGPPQLSSAPAPFWTSKANSWVHANTHISCPRTDSGRAGQHQHSNFSFIPPSEQLASQSLIF